MADDTHTKKITPIRTFADDVRRIRNKGAKAAPETPAAAAVQQIDRVPLAEAVQFEEPIESVAAHDANNLASSAQQTEAQITVPTKTTLQREAVRVPQPKEEIAEVQNLVVDEKYFNDPQPSVHKRSGVFDAEDALRNEETGTIVLDKKRKHFRFFRAVGRAFSEWFGKQKTAIEDARKPKYTIEKSTRRKEVIEAAAQAASHVPSDDYQAVSKRLQKVERTTRANELQIKEAEAATPSWKHMQGDEQTTPHEEQETPLHTDAQPPSQKQEPETQSPPADDTETEQLSDPKTETVALDTVSELEETHDDLPSAPIPTPEPELELALEPDQAAETIDDSQQQIAVEADAFEQVTPETSAQIQDSEEVVLPADMEPPQSAELQSRLARVGQPKQQQVQQGTPLLTSVAVIITATILGVGTSVWWFTRGADEVVTHETALVGTSVIETDMQISLPLSGSREVFYGALSNTIREQQVAVEVYPTIEGGRARADEILAQLQLGLPSNAARSITFMTFGGTTENEPFIAVKFNTFDTMFAGILDWERRMLLDLAPLFPNEPVASIVDSRVNNRDIRVLIGGQGQDLLVYGFTDKNTLLITTNRNAYSVLAVKMQY